MPLLRYGQLQDDSESKEALLSPESSSETRPRRERLSVTALLTGLNVLLLAGSVFFFTLSLTLKHDDQAAIRATSLYSPVLETTNIQLNTETIDGGLFSSDLPWYGTPDEADKEAAWDQLEHIRTIPLTRAQVLKLGKDPSSVAKFEDEFWHLGEDRYVGALDIFHQIHCLNMLRRAAFGASPDDLTSQDAAQTTNKTKPKTKEEAKSAKLQSIHLRHCTSMLMQHLLCTADAGVLTYRWVTENAHPLPDFSVDRKCRDWRQLVAYRDAHAVDAEEYRRYTKPGWIQEWLVREGNHSMFPDGVSPIMAER